MLSQKQLDKWVVNGFSGLHNYLRERGLDAKAPLSEEHIAILETVNETLDNFIAFEGDATINDENGVDDRLMSRYQILIELLINRISTLRSPFHEEVIKALKYQKAELQKLIRGHKVLRERYINGQIGIHQGVKPQILELKPEGNKSYKKLSEADEAWHNEEKFLVISTHDASLSGMLITRSVALHMGYRNFRMQYSQGKHFIWEFVESYQK